MGTFTALIRALTALHAERLVIAAPWSEAMNVAAKRFGWQDTTLQILDEDACCANIWSNTT